MNTFLTNRNELDGHQFIEQATAAADLALTPSRLLVDSSRARSIAIDLRGLLSAGWALYGSAVDERHAIEDDSRTKPQVLRQRWTDFLTAYAQEAVQLTQSIGTLQQELPEALAAEAMPVSTDPSAILVARGEVELAITVLSGDGLIHTMSEFASRGGDISAAVASPWGKLKFIQANGSDYGYKLVQAEAVRAALLSDDPAKRRAAAALQALTTPAPRTTIEPLYESCLLTTMVMDSGSRLGAPVIQ